MTDELWKRLAQSASLAAQGQLEVAIAIARDAVASAPGVSAVHEHAGALLLMAGEPLHAAESLQRALELDPQNLSALNTFGGVLRVVGKTEDAHRYFERALDLSPSYFEALKNAMELYIRRGDFDLAVSRIHRAIGAGNQSAEVFDLLGTVEFAAGRAKKAISALHAALSRDRQFADAWGHMAEALVALGHLDEARIAILEAIRLEPRRASFYRFMTTTMRSAVTQEHRVALRALVADETLPPEQRLEAEFALGDLAQGDRRWQEAFDHYVRANGILRALTPYDEADTLRRFDRIAAAFNADLIRAGAQSVNPSDRPIFIFGMPRSGTTLVEQIIASHPDAFAGGELTLLDEIAHEEFVTERAVTNAVANRYEAAIRRLAPPDALRITDKMPANFMYAGLIHMIFPNARMIHLRRDPLDTCWSCFSTRFAESAMAWTSDLGELGRYYRGYERLMAHWRSVLPPGAMLEVQYEELVGDFEAHARRIVAYCGLEWNDRCLTFYETQRAVQTASVTQVRRPLYASSVGRSRPYGELLRPLAEAIGVEL